GEAGTGEAGTGEAGTGEAGTGEAGTGEAGTGEAGTSGTGTAGTYGNGEGRGDGLRGAGSPTPLALPSRLEAAHTTEERLGAGLTAWRRLEGGRAAEGCLEICGTDRRVNLGV
ncbi:MAG: hypothetical protein ABFD96_00770, partial [Armatimonadia bacterium]